VKNAKEKQMNGRMREGTAGIFRKGFAVFALAGLLAAAAVMTGCEDALAALGGEDDSKNTEEQITYDADGWNVDDPADNMNENGTLFSDVDGLDRQGYDVDGWNGKDENDMKNKNGTLYGADGFDRDGWDAEGYGKDGFNVYGWNRDGQNVNKTNYDSNGFGIDGLHKDTGTQFDSNGYDRDGYDEDGWDINDNHKDTKTKFDGNGYDRGGLDINGFNAGGNYKNKDGQKYADDSDYGNQGYDVNGWDNKGFKADGTYKNTGNQYANDTDYGNVVGYDKNGWDTHGFKADKTYKNTSSQYANDNDYGYLGYDVDGYNENGLNKDTHQNREGGLYGLNGKDWNGNAMPALLAGLDGDEVFIDGAKDVTVPTQFGGDTNLSTITSDQANAQSRIGGMTESAAKDLISQSASLAYAYQQVANKYSGLSTMATAIATQEKTMAVGAYTILTDWKTYNSTYGENINAIWNAVFEGEGKADAKTKFDAYLAAYKIALYKGQSVRSENTEANNAATSFSNAISTLNSTYSDTISTTIDAASNAALKVALLTQINAAMEVDDKVNIAEDQVTLKNLNEILLQQTGDVAELQAFITDVSSIPNASYYVKTTGGVPLKTVVDANSIGPIQVGQKVGSVPTTAMGTQKLNDLINGFDPEYLKLKQQVAGKDEIALV
jgi:hypothetical protein